MARLTFALPNDEFFRLSYVSDAIVSTKEFVELRRRLRRSADGCPVS